MRRVISTETIYEKQNVDVTRKATVTGVPTGYAKAGEMVTLRCLKLPHTVSGMDASFVLDR